MARRVRENPWWLPVPMADGSVREQMERQEARSARPCLTCLDAAASSRVRMTSDQQHLGRMGRRSMPARADVSGPCRWTRGKQVHVTHHRHDRDEGERWHRRNARTVGAGLALTAVGCAHHGTGGIGTIVVLGDGGAGHTGHGRREAIRVQRQHHLRPQQGAHREKRNAGAQTAARCGSAPPSHWRPSIRPGPPPRVALPANGIRPPVRWAWP